MSEVGDMTLLAHGFPIKSTFHGGFGWASVGCFVTNTMCVLIDAGSPAHGGQIRDGLADIDLGPSDVTHVLLTHLHWDHMGNIGMFPNAEVVVHQLDWDWAFSHPEPERHSLSVPHLDHLRTRSVHLLQGNDGGQILPEVSWIFTPGHTPGSVTYAVRTSHGMVYGAGDAIKNRVELSTLNPDMTMDDAASRASIARVRKELVADRSARLIPGHDNMVSMDEQILCDHGAPHREVFSTNFTSDGPHQVEIGATDPTVRYIES